VFIPIFGEELSNVQFLPLDEQRFQAEQRIMGQRDRHATARFLSMHTPVEIRTPEVPPRFASEKRVEEYRLEQLANLPFVLSCDEAQARIEKRRSALALPLITPETEPRSYKRRVPSRATMKKHVGGKDDTGGG
jgi:hypothetical protein